MSHTQSLIKSLNLVVQLEKNKKKFFERLNICDIQREIAEIRLEELDYLIELLYDYLEFNEEQRNNIKNSII